MKNQKCAHEGCRHNTQRTNGFCRAHCPELKKKAMDKADARWVLELASDFLSRRDRIAELERRLHDVRAKESRASFDLADCLGTINRARDHLAGLIAASHEAGDMQRLLDTFEAARVKGDAVTMEKAQKSLYYARKNAKRVCG